MLRTAAREARSAERCTSFVHEDADFQQLVGIVARETGIAGALIEKELTTPDQYPLSLNAATTGSNQKSNRSPVVDYLEAEVDVALQGLVLKGFAYDIEVGSLVGKWPYVDAVVNGQVNESDWESWAFEGSGWMRFGKGYAECETINQRDGRISQEMEMDEPA